VQALEAGGGFAAVGLATAATKAIPSLAGVRLASALTTPLPRVAGAPGAADHHKRSVAAGIALWVVVLAIGLGAPGLYAYKKGLLFFARGAPADSASGVTRDTLAQRLLSDTGVPSGLDTAAQTAAATPHADTARTRAVPPGTPGRPLRARLQSGQSLFRHPSVAAVADAHSRARRRNHIPAPGDPADPCVEGRVDTRGAGVRIFQPRHVQQRGAGHGEDTAVEPRSEKRRAGRRMGPVDIPADEAVTSTSIRRRSSLPARSCWGT